MEPDVRIGPLSYSLEPAEGENSAEKPILFGSLATIAMGLVAVGAGWFAMGYVGSRRLVIWTACLAIPAVGLAVAVLLSPGRRRRRRNAVVAVLAVSGVVVWFAHLALDLSRPSIPQLRAALNGVEVPAGFELLTEREYGNRRCSPRCATVERVYRAGPSVTDPGRDLLRAFFADGWRLGNPNVPPDANSSAVRVPYQVDVFEDAEARTVRLVATGYVERVLGGGGGGL